MGEGLQVQYKGCMQFQISELIMLEWVMLGHSYSGWNTVMSPM